MMDRHSSFSDRHFMLGVRQTPSMLLPRSRDMSI